MKTGLLSSTVKVNLVRFKDLLDANKHALKITGMKKDYEEHLALLNILKNRPNGTKYIMESYDSEINVVITKLSDDIYSVVTVNSWDKEEEQRCQRSQTRLTSSLSALA